jgi:CheY-like chemotaxis protein
MPRPTLLVAEPEPLEALSTRKLVLETGKFNVITAHSTREAIELFKLFPNISGVVLVSGDNMNAEAIARAIREAASKTPIISLEPQATSRLPLADHNLSSHEPQQLLELLRSLFGDPRQIDGGPKS